MPYLCRLSGGERSRGPHELGPLPGDPILFGSARFPQFHPAPAQGKGCRVRRRWPHIHGPSSPVHPLSHRRPDVGVGLEWRAAHIGLCLRASVVQVVQRLHPLPWAVVGRPPTPNCRLPGQESDRLRLHLRCMRSLVHKLPLAVHEVRCFGEVQVCDDRHHCLLLVRLDNECGLTPPPSVVQQGVVAPVLLHRPLSQRPMRPVHQA